MQTWIPSNTCLIEEIVEGEDLPSKAKNAFKSLFNTTVKNAFSCAVKRNKSNEESINDQLLLSLQH